MEKKEDKDIGLIQTFLTGTKNGLTMWFGMLLPGMFFGYAISQVLSLTGLLDIISKIFTPVMVLFGLPGEAITAIITAYLALPGGCGTAAALAVEGILTAKQVAVLFPMMYCVASHVQYIGRVLTVSGVDKKKYLVYLAIGLICSVISGLVMNLIIPS